MSHGYIPTFPVEDGIKKVCPSRNMMTIENVQGWIDKFGPMVSIKEHGEVSNDELFGVVIEFAAKDGVK